jgi:hypothetical protein
MQKDGKVKDEGRRERTPGQNWKKRGEEEKRRSKKEDRE